MADDMKFLPLPEVRTRFRVTVVETITRTVTKVFDAPTAEAAEALAQEECDTLDGDDLDHYEGWDDDGEWPICERVVDDVEEEQ